MIRPALEEARVTVQEEAGVVNLPVARAQGLLGRVLVAYRTTPITAIDSKDYEVICMWDKINETHMELIDLLLFLYGKESESPTLICPCKICHNVVFFWVRTQRGCWIFCQVKDSNISTWLSLITQCQSWTKSLELNCTTLREEVRDLTIQALVAHHLSPT